MKIASVAQVKAQFSACLRDTSNGPVIVTRNGKPVAVLLAVRDDDELERIVLANSPRLREILQNAREQIRGGKGLAHDEFWNDVERPTVRKPRQKARRKSA